MTVPDDLREAIENNTMTEAQIRQLIEIEAGELGLTYAEAMRKARAGELSTGPLGTDIEFLAAVLAA